MSARRIGTVVRIRDLQERLARADVARCQAVARQATEQETARWAELAERDRQLRGMLAAGGLSRRAVALGGGLAAAVMASGRAAAAEHATSEALGRWTIAARDHDGVERLAARLDAEAHADEQRRLAIDLDELVVQRFATAGRT